MPSGKDAVLQGFQVPVVDVRLERTVLVDQVPEDSGNVVFKNQVLLIEAFEQAAA
jgi:hypothetical protein